MKFFREGEKIGLSKLTAEHVAAYYVDWLNDREVTKTLVTGLFPSSIEDVAAFVGDADGPKRVSFAITRKDEGRHIGNVKLDVIDWIGRKADFGILIGDRRSWGQGFASEATALVLRYAFTTLNLERVTLGVLADHTSAIRVYEKLGFIREGVRPREQHVDGVQKDVLIMGVSRSRFLQTQSRVVIIVQARMSSTRLPGKVLLPLAGEPALGRLLDRLALAQRVHAVVVATSTDLVDDAVATVARDRGVACVRGSLEDVLARYHQAAKEQGADVIVRVTADCPLHDPVVIDRGVDEFFADCDAIDYCSNADDRTFPDGLDTEVFWVAALDEAARCAASREDREHVTSYISRRKRKRSFAQHVDLSMLCWTLDVREDYEWIAAIYEKLQRRERVFGADAVYRLLVEEPTLLRTRRAAGDGEHQTVVEKIRRHLEKT